MSEVCALRYLAGLESAHNQSRSRPLCHMPLNRTEALSRAYLAVRLEVRYTYIHIHTWPCECLRVAASQGILSTWHNQRLSAGLRAKELCDG